MKTTLSIIVPIYNVEKYINRCIKSILCQTYEDFELILVDDGSPDHCGAICDSYSKQDERIKVIHQPNSGVSNARNVGIMAARGKYIMFCDPDDYAEPKWAEILVHAANEYPNHWIVCGLYKSNAENTHSEEFFYEAGGVIEKREYFQIYRSAVSGGVWNKIYEKNILERYKIRFDPDLKIGEDVSFNTEYLDHADFIYNVPDVLYHYCINENSVTESYGISKKFETGRFIYKVRRSLITPEYLKAYSEIWYENFWVNINNVMHKDNMKFGQKVKQCRDIMRSDEFQECLGIIDTSVYKKTYLICMKKGYVIPVLAYNTLRSLIMGTDR